MVTEQSKVYCKTMKTIKFWLTILSGKAKISKINHKIVPFSLQDIKIPLFSNGTAAMTSAAATASNNSTFYNIPCILQ